MKYLLILFLLVSVNCFSQGVEFTGKLENLIATDRGIEFDIVVKDDKGVEIYRQGTMVGTGHQTVDEAVIQAKLEVLDRTQRIRNHVLNAEEIYKNKKVELESYQAKSTKYTPSAVIGVQN